jgi:hypothetical protein
MLHLGGAWDLQAMDVGSLAMDSREVRIRESRLAPVVKETVVLSPRGEQGPKPLPEAAIAVCEP